MPAMAGKVVYTAEAHVQGGRDGHGRTSDGALEVDIAPPGGEREGTNPEQLFAIGYGACFESAMRVVARRQKLEVGDASLASKVHLITREDRSFGLAVELDASLPGLGDDAAVDLVRAAHAVCPYSNATRGNVEVTLTANGRPVD